MVAARIAANTFVDIIAENLTAVPARVGVVQFSTSDNYPNRAVTSLIAPLTILDSAGVTSVKSTISDITTDEGTCHECGIDLANKELFSNVIPGRTAQKMVILLTDGRAHMTIASGNASDSESENCHYGQGDGRSK